MSFIAGHYDATWDGNSIGSTREGFHLVEPIHAELITTDDFGDVPVDGIQRGWEARITLDYVDYDLIADAIYAQAGSGGRGFTNKTVGLIVTGFAKVLELTAVAGTPADQIQKSIKKLTANKAVIVTDVDTLLATRLRAGPLTFQLFPFKVGNDWKNYSLTHASGPA